MPQSIFRIVALVFAVARVARADIAPLPLPPDDPPPAIAPDAVKALAGTYELRDGTGKSGCNLTLSADNVNAFDAAREDYKVALEADAPACFKALFAAAGYVSAPLLWNVAAGGGVLLRFDAQPREPWLVLEPVRDADGVYRVEAMGQTLTLMSTFDRPRTLD